DGDDERILERQPEGAAFDNALEILQAHEVHVPARDRDARQAVVKRKKKRDADKQYDVDDRRRQHGAHEPALVVGQSAEDATSHLRHRGRRGCGGAPPPPPPRRPPPPRPKPSMSCPPTTKSSRSAAPPSRRRVVR